MEPAPPDKPPVSFSPPDMVLKALAQAWKTTENLLAATAPPVMKEHVDVAGDVILIGGGISGKWITTEMKNNDLLASQVDPKLYDPTGLYREMVERQKLKGKEIVVVTSASRNFNVTGGEDAKEMFTTLGVKEVHVIDTHDAKELDKPLNLEKLEKAPFVFIDGGDQKFLAKVFENSRAQAAIKKRVQTDKGFTLAGTSAGAMIVSGMMIHDGNKEQGFDLLPIVVDTHFSQRNRSERLEKLLLEHGALHAVAIGVDEGTAVKISGDKVEIFHAGTTQREQEAGNAQMKKVTIMTKKPGADGTPVIDKREYTCVGNYCVMHVNNKAMPERLQVENMDPAIPVAPLPPKTALPPSAVNAPMK